MTFNKKRITQSQRQRENAASRGDEILASLQLLCESTLNAYREGRQADFNKGTSSISKISSQIARFGRELDAQAKRSNQEDLIIDSTPEEAEAQANDIAMRVQILCSSYSRLVSANRTPDARAIAPALRRIKAQCLALTIPDETP